MLKDKNGKPYVYNGFAYGNNNTYDYDEETTAEKNKKKTSCRPLFHISIICKNLELWACASFLELTFVCDFFNLSVEMQQNDEGLLKPICVLYMYYHIGSL